jgi:probable phosphoglycerate mutase
VSDRVLYLIRHGRSDFDAKDFLDTPRGHQWDPPLGEEGREQATRLADRLLSADPPSAVVCSPLRRARQTAEAYALRAGLPVEEDVELAEAFIGDWESRPFEEIIATDERLLHRFRNHEAFWRHAPGAEDLEAFRERVTGAVEGALSRYPDGNVYVFCHGGVVNAYVAPLLGLEQEMFFLPDNTSVNVIGVAGEVRSVRFLNDVRHLTDPGFFVDAEPGSAP